MKMRIEIFAILVCFIFFIAFAAIFLVVKCVQKKARKASGRVENVVEESENENAYNTTVYQQISASEDDSIEESEEEEDIWNN